MWFWGVASAVFLIGTVLLFRWFGKWRDPEYDSEAGRAKAFLWSKGGGGGGAPG